VVFINHSLILTSLLWHTKATDKIRTVIRLQRSVEMWHLKNTVAFSALEILEQIFILETTYVPTYDVYVDVNVKLL
jgi:hypothetical protein